MTLNINGILLDLSKPKIMGILNITPDSFYDGGVYNSDNKILNQVEKMLLEGADIIDIGGYSSRPGAKELTIKQETDRIIPIIELIVKKFENVIISVDTFRSEIAKKAIKSGASIINDISGGEIDNNMYKVVGELKVPYVIMHMKGNPLTMQNRPYYDDVMDELLLYFENKIEPLVLRDLDFLNVNHCTGTRYLLKEAQKGNEVAKEMGYVTSEKNRQPGYKQIKNFLFKLFFFSFKISAFCDANCSL